MPTPLAAVSTDRVRSLAARLGLDGDDADLAAIRDRVDAELESYAVLEEAAGRGRDDAPRDVTIDPGPSADPHNAFLAAFDLPATGDGPLAGLDVALKDNVAVAGLPMTCGSRVFEHATPGEHATVVDWLRDAGAAVVGKTNMDELAYGPTSETSQFGPVTNPVDEDRVAGGSSSGSAAAVAAGDVDAALGTDTGGSVRIPSSLCGVVGVKPSYGVVPRSGTVDLAPSLDHVGAIAPDVETAAAVMDVLAGSDPRDPVSAAADRVGSPAAAVADPPTLSDCSLGVPEELFGDHVDDAVRRHVRGLVDDLADAGATVEQVSLPSVPDLPAAWKVVVNVELATAFLTGGAPVARRFGVDPAWYDAAADAIAARGHAFGETVRSSTVVGAHLLDRHGGQHYTRALGICERFAAEVDAALADHDALASPTTPATAPELAEGGDERRVPLAYNTRPADMAHVPAVSVPAGRVDGLPIGLQLYGDRYEDAALLGLARSVERAL